MALGVAEGGQAYGGLLLRRQKYQYEMLVRGIPYGNVLSNIRDAVRRSA
jgi:hypothetical protein